MSLLRIDVWSDIACPWCYVGKRRLEAALERTADRGAIEIVWRAFELDPSAARSADAAPRPYGERLATKYRISNAQAQGMLDRMTGVAADEGLALHFDRIRPGNTFDAHRLLHLGKERGIQDAVQERLFRAYFSEGAAIDDRDTLVRLGAEAGLDDAEAAAVLATEQYVREVRADETEARALGITGVPFFMIAGRLGVSGAQPADVLASALERGWQELAKVEMFDDGDDEAACGPDGCVDVPQTAVRPPSTTSVVPVVNDAASDSK